jgi:hypothetical protein
MSNPNIHRLSTAMQYRHGGRLTVQGLAFTRLVHRIIREYGQYHDGSFSVWMSDIDMSDRRILLSHITNAEEYEEICASTEATEAYWNENEEYIQNLVDAECDQVYREDMEEMGMMCLHHQDNNEKFWIRR